MARYQNSYHFDAAAGEWIPYQQPNNYGQRANTNANVSTPAGQAVLYGGGWGAMTLATAAGLAWWLHWSWLVPLGLALAATLVASGAFATWVAIDERRLQWQYAPPDPPEPRPQRKEDVRFITRWREGAAPSRPALPAAGTVNGSARTVPELHEDDEAMALPSPVQRERMAYSKNLRFFLRSICATGDATWATWSKVIMPDGSPLGQGDWSEWCNAAVQLGLAERPYETASIRVTGTYQQFLQGFASLL